MFKYIIILIGSFSFFSMAQNFAYIKQADVLKAIPNYEKNLIKADSLKKSFENEFKISKEAFNSKLIDLFKKNNAKEDENIETVVSRMNDLDKAKLEVLRKEEELLKKTEESYNIQLNDFYQKNIQIYLDKLNAEIEKYAKANKFDAVYIYENLRPALAYIDSKKDITKEIINRVK